MNGQEHCMSEATPFINSTVQSLYGLITALPASDLIISYIKKSYQHDPFRIALELFLVFFAIKYMLSKKYKPNDKNVELTEQEVSSLIKEWQPEPLTPNPTSFDRLNIESTPTIIGAQSTKVKVVGHSKPLINLASSNYLNLLASDRIRQKAVETLRTYGVGSCGPPGFYGTIDVHMQLEQDIARFLGTEEAIIYSQGFSTISSVIPAFAKRGDYLVVDDGVSFAVQKGVQISRSIIRTFKHNDMNDLERVLIDIETERLKNKKRLTRRFIVTEGLFANFGDIAPLPKLLELKKKYKYRLIIDESQSFGVIGRRGAGLTDLYNIDAKEVDIIAASLSNAICGSGGFCAGSHEIVDHQRLSGLAYCFSASMPAMLAVSASEALHIIQQEPELLQELSSRISAFRQVMAHISLTSFIQVDPPEMSSSSPFFHIRAKESYLRLYLKEKEKSVPREVEERLLQDVVDECSNQGVLVTRAKYVYDQELHCPQPSIKVCVTIGLTKKETDKAANVLKSAIVKVFGKWRR